MNDQQFICEKFNSPFVKCNDEKKIGIAIGSMKNQPIRGKRYLQMDGTEGWFIWGGENSKEDDFFQSIHVAHINKLFPNIKKYLALAPGFTFIIDAEGYEDVWFNYEQSKKTSDEFPS